MQRPRGGRAVHDFDRSEEIGLYFDLNSESFLDEERDWVGQHFLCLLDAMLENPERQCLGLGSLPRTHPPEVQSWVSCLPSWHTVSG